MAQRRVTDRAERYRRLIAVVLQVAEFCALAGIATEVCQLGIVSSVHATARNRLNMVYGGGPWVGIMVLPQHRSPANLAYPAISVENIASIKSLSASGSDNTKLVCASQTAKRFIFSADCADRSAAHDAGPRSFFSAPIKSGATSSRAERLIGTARRFTLAALPRSVTGDERCGRCPIAPPSHVVLQTIAGVFIGKPVATRYSTRVQDFGLWSSCIEASWHSVTPTCQQRVMIDSHLVAASFGLSAWVRNVSALRALQSYTLGVA